jgi:heterodisulfide reductase subunit A
MIATKQTIITKEHDSSVEALVFYNNLKAYGKDFWGFYQKARQYGVRYINTRPWDIFEDPDTKNLRIPYFDPESDKMVEEEVDLVVLSTGLIPGERNKKIAKALNIELDDLGFFKEKDPLLGALETKVDGIYVCGGALGPIDISESVVQACAASMKAVLRIGD